MGAVSVFIGDDVSGLVSTAAAVTNNHTGSVITTEALTTAAGADYTFVLTDANIAATSVVLVSIANGSNTTSYAVAHNIVAAAGSVTFKVRNAHASVALNGTLVLSVVVL
jgi:hypothetical protein